MRQHLRTFLTSLALLLAVFSNLHAQDCISGIAYEDLNNSSNQDIGEPGVSGLVITLTHPDASTTTTMTNIDGFYQFCNLVTGSYVLENNNLANGVISMPFNYTFGYTQGENLEPFNFAILNLSNFAQITGLVFYDVNKNGLHDPFEPVIEGHGLNLVGDFGAFPLPTNPYGIAVFENMPAGAYQLRSIPGSLPPNTFIPNNGIATFEVTGGQAIQLLFPIQNLSDFGSIRDNVCYDLDADGQNNPEREPGIYGHDIVSLFNAQGEEIASAQTDPSGRYGFMGLVEGNYIVQFNFDENLLQPTTPTNYNVDLVDENNENPGPFYAQPINKRFSCGMAVSTFGAEGIGNRVLSVKDVRDRSGAPAPSLGNVWSPLDLDHPTWRNTTMGEVFGIAVDEAYNIYVSATKIPGYGGAYNIATGDALVYKIDPSTLVAAPYLYAAPATVIGTDDIASANTGLGNITYDKVNKVIYATNMTDGTIVVIGSEQHAMPGQVLQSYSITSFTPASVVGQRVWGIGFNAAEQRVYFSAPSAFGSARIFSIDASGGVLSGAELLELAAGGSTTGNVGIADIAFSNDGTSMLVAERGGAHSSTVFQFTGTSGSWGAAQQVFVGAYSTGRNSSGGVDYAYESFTGEMPTSGDCETFIAASGNALNLILPNYIYGYVIFPKTGNIAPNGWPLDIVDFTNVNSVFLDNDVNTVQVDKGYQGDVEIFDCECAAEDCSTSHGLNIRPRTPQEPVGVGDCCHELDFNNIGQFNVFGISLSLLDGVQFQPGYQIAPGFYTPNFSGSDMIITPNGLGTMPTNINGLINFCLENIHATPQFLVVDYLDENYEVLCTDTLIFECPPQSDCLQYTLDSLVCDSLGYKYTVDFVVPPGTDFDIGYIKFNLDQPLPPGSFVEPIGPNASIADNGHLFSPALMPGDVVSLMYIIHTTADLLDDSLCVIITAHDDLEERLCCFAYENCIPYPYCPMPCDDVEANVIPSYQGEAAQCCDGDPRDYGWLQDLIGDCAALPCGAVVSCCEYEGQRVITIEDDSELCSDAFGMVYDCLGDVIFQYGGIADINADLAARLEGCRVIYDCYQPTVDECCFDLLITDTYIFDPNLITSVQTTIITPGVTFTGQSRLNAIINGWTPTDIVPDQDILWTHNSGNTPNGIDDYLFTFCIEGTISTDSVYVEVDWLNQDSVICSDTVAVYCPYCLQIVNDSLSCMTDALGNQTYLYQFSFINSSAFDVNAVYVGDQVAPADTVLNPGIHMLGTIVPPGATYTGLIPVQFDTSLDSACFDIVLRQIIGDSINISCCYATHCIELPPCSELPQFECRNPDQIQQQNCADVFEPVCGCDGRTYANLCFAQNAGLNLWTPGPCDGFEPDGNVTLTGRINNAGSAVLNWIIEESPDNYSFFIIHRWADGDIVSQEIGRIPANGTQQYSFTDVNASNGMSSYQVIGVYTNGRVSPSNLIDLFNTAVLGLQTSIYAFPSPAIDYINVTVDHIGEARLQLINTDGQVHYQEQAYFNGSPHPVDVSQLTDGVFIVRLRFDDGETVQRRVVKMRE